MNQLDRDRYYLQLAMEEGTLAEEHGTIPIGAVVVGSDGEVVERGRNRVFTEHDPTAHAEIDVLRRCGEPLIKEGKERPYTLYTTVEPCVMCSGAIYLSRVGRVVWALSDDNFGGFRTLSIHPKYERRFNRMEYVAMPFYDFAENQRQRMIRWDIYKGRNNSWPEIDKET